MADPGSRYSFGPFLLEPGEQRLLRDGVPLPLAPKILRTLIVLVEDAGRLVTKQELMQRIWPDTFVAEITLTHNVSVLRKTLGERPEGGSWIETVAKTGYRFAQGVRVVASDEATRPLPQPERAALGEDAAEAQAPAAAPEEDASADAGSAARARPSRWWGLAAGLALAAAAAALIHARTSDARRAPPVRSIAVLPFRALAARPDEAYVELGLAESVIARLSRIPGLEVRPLRSVERYREADAAKAGRELGVDAVLQGSLQTAGTDVRVTAYLVRSRDGAVLWSDTITDRSANLLAAEESLSGRLLDALRPSVVATSRAPSHVEPGAYELYLRGRYLWNRRSPDAMARASESFHQAVERDRGYAAAWAALADAHAMLAGVAVGDPRKHLAEAKSAAAEALRLDEEYGPTHSTLGLIAENYEYDWARAESEYRRAMELSPGDATAPHRLGEMLGLLGRFDEGLALLSRAAAIDPLSPIIHADTAKVLTFAERGPEALAETERVLELDPAYAPAVEQHANALSLVGRREESRAEYERFLRLDPSPTARTAVGGAWAVFGDRPRTERILAEALAADARGEPVVPLYIAQIEVTLGHDEKALDWLERAYREGNILLGVSTCAVWKPLRGVPRFRELCQKLGMTIAEAAPAKLQRNASDPQGR